MKGMPTNFTKKSSDNAKIVLPEAEQAPAIKQVKRQRLPRAAGDQLNQSILGQSVNYTLVIVEPDNIENKTIVWGDNERWQSNLNEKTLSDIIPSLKKDGQDQPAKGRKVGDKIEIADGSRRRMALSLIKKPFMIWVAELTDEQMEHISTVGNLYKPTSAYERGKRYQRLLNTKEISMNNLQLTEGVSRQIISRCIKTSSLPLVVINCFSEINDLSAKAGERLHKAIWPKGYAPNSENETIINNAKLINSMIKEGKNFEASEILNRLLLKPETSLKPKKSFKLVVNLKKGTAKFDFNEISHQVLEKISQRKDDEDFMNRLGDKIIKLIDDNE